MSCPYESTHSYILSYPVVHIVTYQIGAYFFFPRGQRKEKTKKKRVRKRKISFLFHFIRWILKTKVKVSNNQLICMFCFVFSFQDLTIINSYLKHLESLSTLRESHIRYLSKTIRYESYSPHHILFRFVSILVE